MKKIRLSLCKTNNADCVNCRGFDLSIHLPICRNSLRVDLHVHSAELSLFVSASTINVSYFFPSYLKLRCRKSKVTSTFLCVSRREYASTRKATRYNTIIHNEKVNLMLKGILNKILGEKKCIKCEKRLWTGELCEDCLLEIMGRGLKKQQKVN